MLDFINKIIYKYFRQSVHQKTYEKWAEKRYCSNPLISFVIQSHNRSKHVETIVKRLRVYPNCEIIVIDDGSLLNHTLAITQLLNGANEFMFRSNDLYEVITYDRAINIAKGTYVVLLQDDDDFDGLTWIEEGLAYLTNDEQLVILGGRDAGSLLPYDTDNTGLRGAYERTGDIVSRKNSFKIRLREAGQPVAGLLYVQYVDRAPMWIRRELFLNTLKGINTEFAPFQWDDADICLRAWLAGLHVGLYAAKFKLGGLGLGGMQIWNKELHHRQDVVNAKRIYTQFGSQLTYIDSLVNRCNHSIHESTKDL